MGSLDSLKRRGVIVCFGTSSGPPEPVAPNLLAMKGSLFLTRPALADYIADPAERADLAGELFGHVAAEPDPHRGQPALRTGRRPARPPGPRGPQDHRLFDLRHLSAPADRRQNTRRQRHDHCNPTGAGGCRSVFALGSIRVERLTCSIGAELFSNVEPRRRLAADDDLFAEVQGACSCSTRSCSCAIRPSAAPSTWPSPAASAPRLRGPSGRRQRSRKSRTSAHLQGPTSSPPEEHYENAWHCDAHVARDAADGLLCCVRVEGPEVGGDTIWANMAKAYEDLPPHIKDQIR